MNEQSEPTTGEIVRALRCSADDDSFCKKCQYGYALAHAFLCDHGRMNGNAADRLESQERELSGITGELERFRTFHERYAEQTSKKYIDDISALTARAEQAERERDALISSIERLRTKKIELCSICEFEDLIACCHKNHCEGYQLFKRRGLPQDSGQ